MTGSPKRRDRDRDAARPGAAEDRPGRRDEDRHGSGGNGDAAGSRRMPGSQAVARAKAHLIELTGSPPEGVSSLTRTRDGWRVVLEIVELERIPRTTDILASYAIDLDANGELIGYQRVARYYRSDVSCEQ
jgi:hypothetical protein